MARVFATGFEYTVHWADGISTGDFDVYSVVNPHKDPAGNGGLVCFEPGIFANWFYTWVACDESYFGMAWKPFTDDSEGIFWWDYNLAHLGKISKTAGTHKIQIYTPEGTLRAETAAGAYAIDGVWRWLTIKTLIADANGYIEVRINGTSILTYGPADTKPGAETTVNCGYIQQNQWYDDFCVNTTQYTICYDGGITAANKPGIGLTVTSGGATAVVRGFSGDGISGVLYVDTPTGSWANDVAVTDTGVFAAITQGGLNDQNRSWPEECYTVLLAPATASAVTWTPVGAALNVDCINTLPPAPFPDTAKYITTTVTARTDLYTWAQLPSTAAGIVDIRTGIYAKRDGAALSRQRIRINSGGTTYDGPGYVIGTDWIWYQCALPINPGTLAAWDTGGFHSAAFGLASDT